MTHTFSCYITPEHALATTAVGSHEGITDTWAASALNWLFEQLLKFEKKSPYISGVAASCPCTKVSTMNTQCWHYIIVSFAKV